MFDMLQKINQKPKPFEFYTAEVLWTDEHTSDYVACNIRLDQGSTGAALNSPIRVGVLTDQEQVENKL
jgi:hypothetical protein